MLRRWRLNLRQIRMRMNDARSSQGQPKDDTIYFAVDHSFKEGLRLVVNAPDFAVGNVKLFRP